MKRCLKAWQALALACCLGAQAGAAESTLGTHGMALFGDRDGLYVSHLPMFHAPHDYQVVLRVRLADPERDRALRARMEGKPALWTIDPERFALARLAPGSAAPLRGFAADIFEGHFERGGRRVQAGVAMVVEGVVYFKRLDPTPRTGGAAEYLPVGKFLFKRLDRRPDMDHIVQLAAPARTPLTLPLAAGADPEAALARRVPLVGTVHLETADLR